MAQDWDDSVTKRVAGEREKAVQKYGEVALLPGGNPQYDILDYAINEVIGLHRYAQMIQARADDPDQFHYPPDVAHALRRIAAYMRAFSLDCGESLIEERNILIKNNITLGQPEIR